MILRKAQCANTGFSTTEMNVAMPFNLVVVIGQSLISVILWRGK
jgi:hypothetical protein